MIKIRSPKTTSLQIISPVNANEGFTAIYGEWKFLEKLAFFVYLCKNSCCRLCHGVSFWILNTPTTLHFIIGSVSDELAHV